MTASEETRIAQEICRRDDKIKELETELMENNENKIKAFYPAQCACGHIFLETYQFSKVTAAGYIGFCWCGFCQTKLMVKPYKVSE